MNKISVGLYAWGMSGRVFHGPLLAASPDFILAGLLRRDGHRPEGVPASVRIYSTEQEMLADTSLELIVVNTPHNLHFAQTKAVLEAGHHCLAEKPLCFTSAEARELFALANQQQKVLQVFQNRRFDGDFLTLRDLIASGRLGRIVEADLHFDRYRPTPAPGWKESSDQAGSGVYWNLIPHLADQALALFGKPDDVFLDLDRVRGGTGSPDFAILHWRFNHGLRVRLHVSYLVAGPPIKYKISGMAGAYIKYGEDAQEAALASGTAPAGLLPEPDGTLYLPDMQGHIQSHPMPTLSGDYSRFYTGLALQLQGSGPGPVAASEAFALMELLEGGLYPGLPDF